MNNSATTKSIPKHKQNARGGRGKSRSAPEAKAPTATIQQTPLIPTPPTEPAAGIDVASKGEGDDDDDDDEADYRFRKRRIESNFSRYDHDSDEDDATNETCDATVDSDDNPDEEDTAWIINKQKSRIDAEAEIQYGGRQTKEDLDDVDTSLRKFALRGGTRQDSKSRNLFVEPPDSMATLRQDAAQASTLRASANRFRDNKPALEDAARMTTAKRGTESSTNLLPDKAADDQSFLDSLL